MENIKNQAKNAVCQLLDAAETKAGQILVVGCSSSEIIGGQIGKTSSYETAKVVFSAIYEETKKRGIYLAAQCCEHLNRALIVEAECADRYGLDRISVCPHPKAGGSFATSAWLGFDEPVAVEHISAHVGLDIGGTLVGMHLRRVAVPQRLSVDRIGQAIVLAARTRPKYIGGERAKYTPFEE